MEQYVSGMLHQGHLVQLAGGGVGVGMTLHLSMNYIEIYSHRIGS